MDPDLQYYLVINANLTGIGKCFFQLYGLKANTQIKPKFKLNERIITFLFFRFQDT